MSASEVCVTERTDIECYVRSFLFGTKSNMLFLKKGSYIEKWSDSNEQSRGMQGGYYAAYRY